MSDSESMSFVVTADTQPRQAVVIENDHVLTAQLVDVHVRADVLRFVASELTPRPGFQVQDDPLRRKNSLLVHFQAAGYLLVILGFKIMQMFSTILAARLSPRSR